MDRSDLPRDPYGTWVVHLGGREGGLRGADLFQLLPLSDAVPLRAT